MSKVAHGGVHVSQTSAWMRLFSENLHVVTSRSWYTFVETRRIGWTNGKLCSKLHIIKDSYVKRCVQTHLLKQRTCLIVRSQRAKQWKLSTQTCPRMSKVAHGRVLVSQNGAESYRGQSSSSVALYGQSSSNVVVSHGGHSFFVVSRCGQSSWSVVFSWSVVLLGRCCQSSSWSVVSSWMMFIFYGGYAHVFTETYGWGKPRSMSGQMYGGG